MLSQSLYYAWGVILKLTLLYTCKYNTVVPLLRDHPVVSSGIVVLNVRWSLIRGSLKRVTTVYHKPLQL